MIVFRCECGNLKSLKFRNVGCPICGQTAKFRENVEKKCGRGHEVIWNTTLLSRPNKYSPRWTCACNPMAQEWEVTNICSLQQA